MKCPHFFTCVALVLLSPSLIAQTASTAANNPQAVAFAAKAIAALSGSTVLKGVTLSGTVTRNGTETGSITLQSLGTDESLINMTLPDGSHTEVRDAQTGTLLGSWTSPKASGSFALHNCLTDASWFFPALSALSAPSNIVLIYVGQETRDGVAVQHIQSQLQSQIIPSPNASGLGQVDYYLDATTMLPVAMTFNNHPDNDALTNLPVEVRFSNYQVINGVNVPMRIQRYQQGNLLMDITLSSATFNSGLPLSTFAVN